ncbi:MAG TPA: 5-oxoprolinase subunit PxpB [Pseudoneobacillus sp.]|nr:5-oxoprolinase subunit PxpB [Pseudoneobacillus sp.]
MEFKIYPLSENALLIQFDFKNDNLIEQIQEVQKAIQQINLYPFDGFLELVPAYHTITIYYNPYVIKDPFPFLSAKRYLESLLHSSISKVVQNKRYFEIPVCYEGEFALDLSELASCNNLTIEEAIHLHTSVVYDIVFIGFSPGFPFLAGLDKNLHYPRKKSPRLKVRQGSVGIAGNQTGIYPLDSPGGWQIIGRTPIRLFDITNEKPTLLKAGDQIKFYSITQKEFEQWEKQQWE